MKKTSKKKNAYLPVTIGKTTYYIRLYAVCSAPDARGKT